MTPFALRIRSGSSSFAQLMERCQPKMLSTRWGEGTPVTGFDVEIPCSDLGCCARLGDRVGRCCHEDVGVDLGLSLRDPPAGSRLAV
jgi:hypothetical protein